MNTETKLVSNRETELAQEVENLKRQIKDYNSSVTAKLDQLEQDALAFEQENSRLLASRDTALIERDLCIGLVAKLAAALGYAAAVKHSPSGGGTIVVQLPSGQVHWNFESTEEHLYEHFENTDAELENLSVQEKYNRVMNPNL